MTRVRGRRTLMCGFALALALSACSDAPSFVLPEYPIASKPPRFTSRTVTDDNGLVYFIDDTSKCVQIAFDSQVASDCLPFTPSVSTFYQSVWRSADEVIGIVIVGESTTTAPAGSRRVAHWYTATHDPEADVIDAVELEPGVFVTAYRSPLTARIWGVQLRTPDGRLLHAVPVVGQFLNALR